jgi:hypothetical protein
MPDCARVLRVRTQPFIIASFQPLALEEKLSKNVKSMGETDRLYKEN